MSHRFALSWIVFALLLALGAGSASAQDLADIVARPKQAGPEIVAVGDIPAAADSDERLAQEIVLLARQDAPTSQLEPRLDAITASVREKSRLYKFADLKHLPVRRLESLERHWKFDARQFSDWRADMQEASAPFSGAAAEVVKRKASWQATRDQGGGSLPSALQARITSVLAQLTLADMALSNPLETQIRLGRRANALDAEIQAGRKSLLAAIDYSDRRLTRIDAPPIWTLTQSDLGDTGALAAVRSGTLIELRFLQQYSVADGNNRRALNIFQLILLSLLAWLAIRNRKATSDTPEIQSSIRVLRRPISSWILLSSMVVLLFEPDAPMLLQQLAMLIALIPVLRLLPPYVYRLLGPWPYVATGLYLLERLSFIFLANDLLYRTYFLALTVLGLLLTLWLLWRSRHLENSGLKGRAGQLVHVTAWVSVALFVVSASANVVGNVSLAEMLTAGLLDSGYMGLVLYAAVTVFVAVLRLVLAGRWISHLRIVRDHAMPMLHSFKRLLGLAAVIGWIVFTLDRFRAYRPIRAVADSILGHVFHVGEISISLGNVLLFSLTVVLAFWAARTTRFVLKEEVLPGMSLPRGVGNSVASLSYYALLLLGLLVALAASGFKVGQLTLVFGALGVGIGLGLQDVVKNFVSGLILMFERPIQPGDVVEITGTTGRVREIGMRATTLTTFEGADVVVPNGTLLSEKLVNWTLRDMTRRLDVEIGVAYGSDPEQVMALLREATMGTPDVMDDPAPSVLFTGFGASSLDFSIRAWTHDFANWPQIRSMLLVRINSAIVRAGIEIPFPQTDMHVRSVSDATIAAFGARGVNPPAAGAQPAEPEAADPTSVDLESVDPESVDQKAIDQ
ncbi:hypothetical protein BH11PSE14_BH11PSE14_01380 [soil metagenome]